VGLQLPLVDLPTQTPMDTLDLPAITDPELPAPDDPISRRDPRGDRHGELPLERRATIDLSLQDEDGTVEPAPTGQGGFQPEPEMDRLSSILQSFNDLFAEADFTEEDRIRALENINGPIMHALAGDTMLEATLRNSDRQNTMIRFRNALQDALIANIDNNTKVFTKRQESQSFAQGLEALVSSLQVPILGDGS